MSKFSIAIDAVTAAAAHCAAVTRDAAPHLNDNLLLEAQSNLAAIRRHVDAASAIVAGQIAHRSRRELGYSGLAQSRGARTPELLIQTVTGATAATTRQLVRVGVLMTDLAAAKVDPEAVVAEPWLVPVAAAAAAGLISVDACEVIRVGLGRPNESVSIEHLTAASARLAALAPTVPPERLACLARDARDELDAAGVASREEERRDRRYLRLISQSDGMTRITGLLDPESAAVVSSAIDAATSPRRGGPRFVDAQSASGSVGFSALENDDRTVDQVAVDALVALVDVAVRAESSAVLGARRPSVRVIVTQRDLDRRAGAGQLEGQSASISLSSVERAACDGGLIPILFDEEGGALNLGRTQRLHNARQRIAIATRDGGCLAPGCDRPPSWCEVHHVTEFSRGGRTDLADGVLLCRHHHLFIHNNGWAIRRDGGTYRLVPPPGHPSGQVVLASKSAPVRGLLASA